MDDLILRPPELTASEPFERRWGLSAQCAYRVGLGTSITQSGGGESVGAKLTIAQAHDEAYAFTLDAPFGSNSFKLFPSTDSTGTTAGLKHWSVMAGFGRVTRPYSYFNGNGDFTAAISTGVIPMIGYGQTTLGGQKMGTLDVGSTYALNGEWRPWGGRGPQLSLGPALDYGVQYKGPGSAANKVRADFMVNLAGGYGDGSARSGSNADAPVGPMGTTYGLFQLLHGFLLRWTFIETVSKPMEALQKQGLLTSGTGDRGSLWDVPLLQAGAALAGGAGSPLSIPLRSGSSWMWGFAALRAAGGVGFLTQGSTDAKAGGIADLLMAARLAGYGIAGIGEPSKRLSRGADDVRKREIALALASHALGTAVMLTGAAAKEPAMMSGGSTGALGVALSPDAASSDLVERTDVGAVYSAELGPKKGRRGGVLLHKSVRNFPSEDVQLFFSAMLLSPVLAGGGSTNYALNSDISAAAGIQWRTAWTRFLAGVETRGIFGGGEQARAAVGALVGADLLIPFNGKRDGSGLGAGLRASCDKIFPSGWQCGVAPWAGVTWHF